MDEDRAFEILKVDRTASINDIEKSYEILIQQVLDNDKKMELDSAKEIAIHEVQKYDRFFVPLDRKGLIIVNFAALLTNVLRLLCLLNLYGLIFKRRKFTGPSKFGVEIYLSAKEVEVWILALLVLEVLALRFIQPAGVFYIDIWNFIAIYGLINVLGITMDELLQPLKRKSDYVRIRSISRWLIFSGINIFQIVICFAILMKSYGYQFSKTILNWETALYQSILTFTTLGYGEYVPICNGTKFLVIFELVAFILIIGFKLPMAINVIKVKVVEIKE